MDRSAIFPISYFMGSYSIKDIAQFCGIKPHTVRMWEQRHDLVTPRRTETNIRYYDDADLRKLMNVAILRRHGFRISRIVEMSDDEVSQKILEITEEAGEFPDQVDALTMAMIDLNRFEAEELLDRAIVNLGMEGAMTQVIGPLMHRIGALWQTGGVTPLFEHFMSQLVIGRLHSAIGELEKSPMENARTVLLFLPEGEFHEIGLLFAFHEFLRNGLDVTYMGQHLPFEEVFKLNEKMRFDAVYTSITSPICGQDIEAYITRMAKSFPQNQVFVAGFQIKGLEWVGAKNVTLVKGPGDMQPFFD